MKEFSPDQVSATSSKNSAPSSMRPRVKNTCASACCAQGSLRRIASAVRASNSVHIRNIHVRHADFQRDPQHLRRIAAIELKVLVSLDDGEVLREFVRDLIAKANGAPKI